MLTQQLAIARSEDDGRIADTSFCGDTLSRRPQQNHFSKCPVQQMPFYTLRFLSITLSVSHYKKL